MSNVVTMPGCEPPPTGEPNDALIQGLEKLLELARSGELQSFIGTGFDIERGRVCLWADYHDSVWEMMGSLTWLVQEYTHQHSEVLTC